MEDYSHRLEDVFPPGLASDESEGNAHLDVCKPEM